MQHLHAPSLIALLCAASPLLPSAAQSSSNAPPSRLDVVQVTATRFGEQVQEVPQSITVVTGDDIRARGATDLRTALALVGGAGIVPGGDSGPAGVSPALLGLREADDFLLLVDGVPAGGAFTPPFEAVSLNNVERIEVLRGTAPVYFGTTAFAGTINVIHYPAGEADKSVSLSYGSHGSATLRGAAVLSGGDVRQSVAAEVSRDRLSDPRAGFDRAQGSYRLAAPLGGGDVRLDLNLLSLRQRPASPTPVGDDGSLSSNVPIDFNQNPADGHLNTQRQQLVLGYDKVIGLGTWGSTFSLTHTHLDAVQGFLVEDGLDQPGDNAQGTYQARQLHELFIDSHITSRPMKGLDITYGVNELYGRASQDSQSYAYRVMPDGGPPPTLAAGTPGDENSLQDRRSYFGLYAQSRLGLSSAVSLLGGLRWNRTVEFRRTGANGDTVLDESQRSSRLSGSFGAQWRLWKDPSRALDDVSVYASVGNTFQPPQLDFGADAGSEPLLRPETQRSASFGVKADGFNGHFDLDLSAFIVDFANQAVASQVDGSPVLKNGGSERYQGFEVETSYRPAPAWSIVSHASYGEARYRNYTTLIDDTPTTLDGHLLVMTPRLRGGLGVVLAPAQGFGLSLTVNYTGLRYIDSLNASPLPGFTVLDGSVAYRFQQYTVSLAGSNLTNRRDAVLPSELGEGQLYRLPGRRAFASVAVHFE